MLALMLVDSHCHLDFPDYAGDVEGVVARARAAGVGVLCQHRHRTRALSRRARGGREIPRCLVQRGRASA